ncbi:hypothetical protein EDC96DRAFT_512273 [Choanephora cucurbitarum]|nr:hypothetical protein EDC96DRAFT_512273 [Choanephora cucurbitarum]
MEDEMTERFGLFHTMTITPRKFPSIDLFDVNGNTLDINRLTLKHHLILITLKSTTCPACPELLKLLNLYGLDENMHDYIDPFTHQQYTVDPMRKKFFRLLLKHDAYFIILCPGTNREVQEIQHKTPFLDYPFVSSEGGANRLVKALKVQLSEEEFMPAILSVSPHTLSVDSVYIGRGPGQYFHQHLLNRLIHLRLKQEQTGIYLVQQAHETIQLLKRRQLKCQEGNLAMARLSLSVPTPTEPVVCEPSVFDQLPSELVEWILSSFELNELVKASGTCRLFYRAVCQVMIIQVRAQVASLASALPPLDRDESEVILLDRWSDTYLEGASFDILSSFISTLSNTLSEIDRWTKQWSPRRTRSR